MGGLKARDETKVGGETRSDVDVVGMQAKQRVGPNPKNLAKQQKKLRLLVPLFPNVLWPGRQPLEDGLPSINYILLPSKLPGREDAFDSSRRPSSLLKMDPHLAKLSIAAVDCGCRESRREDRRESQ